MSTNLPISVAIIDSNPIYLAGYNQLLSLSSEFKVAGAFSRTQQMIQRLKLEVPSIILTGIESEDWDITDLLAYKKRYLPQTTVVVNGSVNPGPLVKLLLRQGVSSYFLRNEISQAELTRILVQSHQQGIAKSKIVTQKMMDDVIKNKKSCTDFNLSDREMEILVLSCQGYDRKMISKHTSISESTVKFHLDKMREKFHCKSVLQLVLRALKEELVTL